MPHNTERLGDLLDSLVPVLVERLHETGLGEIEIERDGAIVRVRAKILARRHHRRQPQSRHVQGRRLRRVQRQHRAPAMIAVTQCARPPLAL